MALGIFKRRRQQPEREMERFIRNLANDVNRFNNIQAPNENLFNDTAVGRIMNRQQRGLRNPFEIQLLNQGSQGQTNSLTVEGKIAADRKAMAEHIALAAKVLGSSIVAHAVISNLGKEFFHAGLCLVGLAGVGLASKELSNSYSDVPTLTSVTLLGVSASIIGISLRGLSQSISEQL